MKIELLVKVINKIKKEMFEEFAELKGTMKELEDASDVYLRIISKYKYSVNALSMIFEDRQLEELHTMLETCRMIACFRYTKETYESIHCD